MNYQSMLSKNYPPSPLDNDRCHSCWYYEPKVDFCEYYLKTGKRHPQPPEKCNRRIPASLVAQKKTHPWYFVSGRYQQEKINAAPESAIFRSGKDMNLPQ